MTKPEDILPAPEQYTPEEARRIELSGHALEIALSADIAAEHGLYPSELGSFVLNQFIDFDGSNFAGRGEDLTDIQRLMVERSDPGILDRTTRPIDDRARDASGAKKTVRDWMNAGPKGRTEWAAPIEEPDGSVVFLD